MENVGIAAQIRVRLAPSTSLPLLPLIVVPLDFIYTGWQKLATLRPMFFMLRLASCVFLRHSV